MAAAEAVDLVMGVRHKNHINSKKGCAREVRQPFLLSFSSKKTPISKVGDELRLLLI